MPRPILVAGDAIALILFAVVGLLHHAGAITASGLARDALPLLAGWFVVALLVGTYRRGSLGAYLANWAVGITAGVVLRAAVLHRGLGTKELTFLGVTLAVTPVFLLAVRGLVWVGALARARTRADRPSVNTG